ncbi:MAG: DUF6206 family protein [Actinomycetota bacterium]|nr:DUF6206 family protein [Actinomycetota bacterium]
MSEPAETIDLAAAEAAVRHAIRRRNTDALQLLGHGEISLVMAWPSQQPSSALKRVPPFRDEARARQYIDVCEQFFQRLRVADVAVLPTTLHLHVRSDGRAVVYHQQPIADARQLGTNVLRTTSPEEGHPLLLAVADAAARVCAPTVGFDCQMANWLWDGSTATQLDFTSPFVLDESRSELTYDSHAFLQEYPVLTRFYLKRELTSLVLRFTTPEGALGDMLANMLKEGLDDWVDPAIRTINDRLGVQLRRETAQEMLDNDRKLLPMVLKLKKGQRWWLNHTGRSYEQLLPERTTYER